MNLHTQEKIIKNKLGLLNLAKEMGNHQGKNCEGTTPMECFAKSKP
jgi:hypothetical protein